MTTTEHHYDYLISVLGRIREVTGVGQKPMLSELPEAIAQVISDLKTQSAPQPAGRSAEVSRIRDEYVNRPSKYSYGKNDIGVLLGVITALEAQPKPTPSVLTSEDEQGNISGHEVVGCSGGADYVDGFPRVVMLQQLEGGEVVTYHHEATLPKAPASAVECAQKIGANLSYYFDEREMGFGGIRRELNVDRLASSITAFAFAHTASAVAEAREKASTQVLQALVSAKSALQEFQSLPLMWGDGTEDERQKQVSLSASVIMIETALEALKGKAAEGGV